MTRTSLNIRIANAMQGAALHVWNLMQVNTERVLTAQDIARHYAAMGRKNPTQSKYLFPSLPAYSGPTSAQPERVKDGHITTKDV